MIWCNVSLTAAAAVACAPQIRTLFLKRFKMLEPQHEVARTSLVTTQNGPHGLPDRSRETTQTNEKRSKSTPLILSNKFLSGDGKVAVGNVWLSKNRNSGELEIV